MLRYYFPKKCVSKIPHAPSNSSKFIYSEKATNSSTCFWLALHRTKVRWRVRKILWPSQNTWTLSNWIIGIISKGLHVLDFQNLFLSGVPSIIYEVNLEKRKNGLCVGHLLKKEWSFFSHNCHQKHNGKKEKNLTKNCIRCW